MTGPLFLQTLTKVGARNASLNDLADVAEDLGVEITASGIDQRIHERTVDFMQNMFSESVELFKNHIKIKIDIIQRFYVIELLDNTSIGYLTVCTKNILVVVVMVIIQAFIAHFIQFY